MKLPHPVTGPRPPTPAQGGSRRHQVPASFCRPQQTSTPSFVPASFQGKLGQTTKRGIDDLGSFASSRLPHKTFLSTGSLLQVRSEPQVQVRCMSRESGNGAAAAAGGGSTAAAPPPSAPAAAVGRETPASASPPAEHFHAPGLRPATGEGAEQRSSCTGHVADIRERWQPLPQPVGPDPVPVVETYADTHPWTSSVWASAIDMRRHIFCNRSLNMKSIVAVGFDMDYTLAQYRPETFEALAYSETVKKLVYKLGYPLELLEWSFDVRYMVRGLVLDKKRGNIVKMDRHKYVKVAYHGFRELTREERRETYNNTLARESFDEPDFALIDTLFSLAEAYLFAQLVDFCDAHPERMPQPNSISYAGIYRDVRAAVDLCHRDGTLKNEVAANPAKFICHDSQIVPMLRMLKDSGRITFLVTNSLWDYTNVVMSFLCGKKEDNGSKRDFEWLSLFDVVITGSAKPGFFLDGNRAPIFEVDIHSGMLQNTDNGNPMAQVGASADLPIGDGGRAKLRDGCRVFQGGSVSHLHRMLNIAAGPQVLYVGDHIYGDILRSKKTLGWRTMLVVPELVREIECLKHTQSIREEFKMLRNQMASLEDSIQRLDWAMKFGENSEVDVERMVEEMEALKEMRNDVRKTLRSMMQEWHQTFHVVWGQLMKTGYQNSRFAHQVERFACLYTSHVANLFYYSPDKSYKTCEDFMPHEFDVLEL